MEFESNKKNNPVEKSEQANIEQAIQGVKDHIKDEALTSPRFQAFADHVDYIHAEHLLSRSKNSIEFNMEYALIQETIRQRKNGIRGYKKEYEGSEKVAFKLGQAIARKKEDGEEVTDYHIQLGYIKNEAIDEKSKEA